MLNIFNLPNKSSSMSKRPHSQQRNKTKKTCHSKPESRLEHVSSSSVIPEGYMTSEEFRKQAIVKVNTFCTEHGIL
jgi:hypothetical protein